MKVLVTGASGFLGSYTARRFAERGDSVVGTYFEHDHPPNGCPPWGHVPAERLDIRSTEAVETLIARERPDVIFHYAGQAYVQRSFRESRYTHDVNFIGTLNLLETIRHVSPTTKVVFAGSGTAYGEPAQIPTPETCALAPTSPYAASKAAADLLCLQYHLAHQLPILRLRIFGTTGVGKTGDFCNDVAGRIAAAERNGATSIRVGRVDVRREIMDVEDFVGAAETVALKGTPGEVYNVGGGQAYLVSELLDKFLSFSTATLSADPDPRLIRTADEPVHLGDTGRLRALGWAPTIPIEGTLRRILDWHRRQG
ncbi:MAG: GDP-mannose 4,6-dehydratase [Thermoplasmata archaeon]